MISGVGATDVGEVRVGEECPDFGRGGVKPPERLPGDFKEVTGPLRDLAGYTIVLDVFPAPFVRGEIRGVRRQEEQLDAILVLFHPFAGLLGSMIWGPVHDEEYLAVDVVDEESQILRVMGLVLGSVEVLPEHCTGLAYG